ncbi:hypothetical protein TRFO_36519 [Tritrichomonas foetus]|uniref:Uncharacterized protein n=1 Tax=Tritrichomonas foetus TaxID=1144522 RepID=A0A1J4JDP5_9EUKA|nr:hypothetical protein TRFO_36519 [Tritrichomonas foetus]|eukprot:OHS97318.1 hypothetical protein TRFO_36519 [Tritrichomonas foetus]
MVHVAAYYDSFEVLLYLQSLGLSLSKPSGSSYFPLHYACAGRAKECAAYILEQEPELARNDVFYFYLLCYTFDFYVLFSIFMFYFYFYDVPYQPLVLATFANSPEILKMLLDKGANVMSRKNVENHVFQQAIKSRSFECLVMLLQHQCKTDVTSTSTPLMLAITSGMSDAVEPLLKLGLDPYFVSPRGDTALSHACMAGDVKTVKLLCEKMDIIEIPSNGVENFSSIARFAVSSKNLEILKTVLEKGCDLNRYDYSSEVPADTIRGTITDDLAVKFVDMMVKYGFDINVRSEKRSTSFLDRLIEFATVGKYPKVCDYLLSHGADVRYKFADGTTLLDKVKKWKNARRQNQKIYYEIFCQYFPEIAEE